MASSVVTFTAQTISFSMNLSNYTGRRWQFEEKGYNTWLLLLHD